MPLVDNPHLYIVGLSLMVNAIFVVFILYCHRERKRIRKLLDELNRHTSKKDQAISEKFAQLADAYENILKINQRLEEEVHLGADNLTNQHGKVLEHIRFYSHKLRGTLASMVGLLQLAQTEEMSQNLKELLEMMNTCTHLMDQVLHEFTRQIQDDI